MFDKKTYEELLDAAHLCEKQNLPEAAKWLHAFIVGAHPTSTLAMFEANIDGGVLRLECLTKEGFFFPCFGLDLEHALKDRYRFPPLFRVTQAGHKPSS